VPHIHFCLECRNQLACLKRRVIARQKSSTDFEEKAQHSYQNCLLLMQSPEIEWACLFYVSYHCKKTILISGAKKGRKKINERNQCSEKSSVQIFTDFVICSKIRIF